MSRKRPSLIDSLKVDTGEGGSEPPATVVQTPPATKPAPKKGDVVKSTMYLPPKVHQKLREIAFAKDCKIHDLVMDGIDRVLKEHGHPSVKELKDK